MFKTSTTTPTSSPRRFNIRWLRLSKRKTFVIIAVFLSLAIFWIQSVPLSWRYSAITAISLTTLGLTILALRSDLRGAAWLLVGILPSWFTASLNLFYFLLPEGIWIRFIVVGLYALGLYALLLTENIFSVASIRTIQLLRAAHALGFVFTLLIAFLFYDTIFSFRLHPWWNMLAVVLVTLPLVLQGLWCMKLEEKISPYMWIYTLAITWLMAQAAWFISLWPISVVLASLFLVTLLYVCLGIVQQALIGRMFRKTVREYVQVGVVVFLILLFSAQWGG